MSATPLTTLAEDELMFRDGVLAYAREEIGPHVAEMDAAAALKKELLPGLFRLGVMGIEIPERFGGSGSSFFNAILAIEMFAVVDPSISVVVDVQNTLVNNVLVRLGSDAQKERYLPRLAREQVGSYCLSESGSGSDAFALRTRAVRRGDAWVLTGRKLWITNGAESDIFIVFATVDPDAGYKGITAFLVERGCDGFTVGKKEDKLGIRASSTCELIFEECAVPAESVVGEVGRGYKIAIETLNEGRIGIGAQMIGLAQGAFDLAMRYMLEREQFGKRIAEFQGMEFQYAEVATEIEAARLMVYNAARMKDAGMPFIKQAAMAKLFASGVAERAASMAIEFHGGVGFTRDFGVEKYYRDAKIGKIYEGTSNMQRSTIARLLRAEYGGR